MTVCRNFYEPFFTFYISLDRTRFLYLKYHSGFSVTLSSFIKGMLVIKYTVISSE